MKKNTRHFMTLGIPSVFLVFAVLCLVIFSLLTLNTSRSDYILSQEALEQTISYYEACSNATDLYCNAQEGTNKEETVTIDIPFSDTQLLHVFLELDGTQKNYRILNWETQTFTNWEANTLQPVFKGDLKP